MVAAFPKVAVVTPVYNGSPWLERNVRCVQQQTYPNLVHILRDNASTDDTPEVIARAGGGKVPIVTQRNATLIPQAENFNAAMSLVGDDVRYVKLLAADDLMRSDAIEKMTALAESDPEIDYVQALDVFGGEVKPHGLDPRISVYDGKAYARMLLHSQIPWISATHSFFRVTPERIRDPFVLDVFPLFDTEFLLRDLLHHKMGIVFEPLTMTHYDERTVTANLGGFRSYRWPFFQIVTRHGGKYLPEDDFHTLVNAEARRLAAYALVWQLSGDRRNAETVFNGMAAAGYSLSSLDWALGLASYFARKVSSQLRSAVSRVLAPPQRVPESLFVTPVAPPQK